MNADNEEVVKWRKRERMQRILNKRRWLSMLPAYKKGHMMESCDPNNISILVKMYWIHVY